MKRPLLICLTATRNYGWVMNAFLKANCLWADYIIIADQHSTDGSRELALKYPNVIVLDNDDPGYGETARSQLVIDRAREIVGDKILFYLAIDEVLSANYLETEGWEKILNSVPGDVFFFQWANLCPDKKNYWASNTLENKPFYMARMFHDDGFTPYDNEGLDMHTHCIPYPVGEKNEYYVDDFTILHFGEYNLNWNISKQRFYQFVDFDKNNRNITTLSRMYKRWTKGRQSLPIPQEWLYKQSLQGFDLFNEVNLNEQPFFDKYVLGFITKNGIKRYSKLDVWDKSFLSKNNIKDPRPFWVKIIHLYFHITCKYSRFILIRIIDKTLKISSI